MFIDPTTGYPYGHDPEDASRWVDPSRRDTKRDFPYSYSEFFLFGSRQTIKKSTDAEYSDRLRQFSQEKWNRAHDAVRKRFDQMSEAEVSRWLSAYFGREVEVVAFAEGCNPSSGYPYFIFWHRDKAEMK